MGEVFVVLGGADLLQRAAVALFLWVGSVRLCNVAWVEIDPPSSVAYATASPQGEAFLQDSFALHKKATE